MGTERVLGEFEDNEQELHIPPGIYLPPSARQWRGLLVMVVSQDVVKEVTKKFESCFSESVRTLHS